MHSWTKLLTISILLVLVIPFSVPWVSATNGTTVPSVVSEAEGALLSAYNVVLDAEASGANVSDLLNNLTVGGEYLAEAYVNVRLGNSAEATRLAGLCRDVASDVQSDAAALNVDGNGSGIGDNAGVIFGSVVAVILVIVACFAVWNVFKRNYRQKMTIRGGSA